MGNFGPKWFLKFMKYSWMFLVPLSMTIALVLAMVKFRSPTYGNYVYPKWINVFGWILAIGSSLPIPAFMVYALLKQNGTFYERLRQSVIPVIGREGGPVVKRSENELMLKHQQKLR